MKCVVTIPKVYFRSGNLILWVSHRIDFNDLVSCPTDHLQWYSLFVNNETLCCALTVLKYIITIPKVYFRLGNLALWVYWRLDVNDFVTWPTDQFLWYALLFNNETLCCARTVLKFVVTIPKVYFRLENLVLWVSRRLDFNDFVSWPTCQLQWYSILVNNETLCCAPIAMIFTIG